MYLDTHPYSWTVATIDDLTHLNPTLDKSQFSDDLEVSFVPMPAVEAESGKMDVSNHRKFSEVKKGYTPFNEGDVLFAKITPCMENGKMAVVPAVKNGLGFGSTEYHVLRPYTGIETKFLYFFVSSKQFRNEAEHNMSGAVGQRRVPKEYLSTREIPLPPFNEQRRIVAKIEELFSELDKGIESLKTARAQLKVYRQALLKHAFEGKLTAKWREENKDKLETAGQLMKRIKAEREQRYKDQLAEWEKNGSQGRKPAKPKELPPLSADELAGLPELPEGWGWVRIGQLNIELKRGPFGSSITKSMFVPTGYKVYEQGNAIYRDVFRGKYFINKEKYKELAGFSVKDGDFIVSCAGTVGRIYELPVNAPDGVINQALMRIRLNEAILDKPFFAMLFESGHFQRRILTDAKGTAMVNLAGIKELNLVPVAICGVDEQVKVSELIDASLSRVDQLEQTIGDNLQQAEALRQSILKKAFSGQLVPQDPHDEPASVLLERIKAEKVTVSKMGKVAAKPRKTRTTHA